MADLTRERFEALAEAYGGDVSRWPEDVREAAAVRMAGEPKVCGEILGRAGALDAALDAWRPAPASPGLMERILAAAPRMRRPRWLIWLSPAVLGAGLAAGEGAGKGAGFGSGSVT